jgi:hypothetical protein
MIHGRRTSVNKAKKVVNSKQKPEKEKGQPKGSKCQLKNQGMDQPQEKEEDCETDDEK